MASQSPIEHYNFAEEFLEAIDLQEQKVVTHPLTSRVFRGQADAEWDLIPSAHRDWVVLLHPADGWKKCLPSTHTVDEQAVWERATLADFFWRADAAGLHVPEDTQRLREYLDTRTHVDGRNWPEDFALPALAVAQHHGVPTRLLDWTRSSLVAAYFAAAGAARMDPRPDQLAVWSLDLASMFPRSLEDHLTLNSQAPTGHLALRAITSSARENPNLKAQQGLFVFDRRRLQGETRLSPDGFRAHAGDHLRRITLIASRAQDLLRLLERRGVHGASMFPGFGGVRAAQEEFMLWQRLVVDDAAKVKTARRSDA